MSVNPAVPIAAQASPTPPPSRAARAGLIVLGIGAWFFTQSLIAQRTPPEGHIDDGMHRLLAPLHDYLWAHSGAANALMIVSSAFIDGLAIFVLLRAIFGPTIRPFVGLFILFALRQLCQALCSLPEPHQMIWHYPGVPALLVTYGVAPDLFFSGHTSVAVYGAIELNRLGRKWLAAAVLIAVFEMLTVLALRAHYTMDVFAALMTALVAARVADRVSPALDRALIRAFGKRPA
ncbi:MAG: phosphatase PAP2-related protein [Planctomycetota bacterium]